MNDNLGLVRWGAFVCALVLGFPVFAGEAKAGNPADEVSLWYKGNRLQLKTRDEGKKFEADWAFEISDGGDVRLIKHETRAGKKEDGEVIMLSSGVMMIRGFEVEKGWELGALDGPALATQLALKLLHLAFPQGPASVGENSPIRLQDAERSIRVSTPSSDGMLMAPWFAEGSASRQSDGEVSFEIVARARQMSGGEVTSHVLPMAGTWKRDLAGLELQDAMPIEGWRVFVVAPLNRPLRGQRELASGDLAADAGFQNLGDLRRAITAAVEADR